MDGLAPGDLAFITVNADAGKVGLDSLLAEIAKLELVRGLGLTPLIWAHVSPYGAFDLDMDRRLDIGLKEAA